MSALKPWPDFFREQLAALPDAKADPEKGWPWMYGAASQIATGAIIQLEIALAHVKALEDALREVHDR